MRLSIPGELRRIIGKQLADVPLRRRTKQRITERVDQHISIRMGLHAQLMRDLHPTQHQTSPRRKTVCIIALPNAHASPPILNLKSQPSQTLTMLRGGIVTSQPPQPNRTPLLNPCNDQQHG